jgi:hypothetical protein
VVLDILVGEQRTARGNLTDERQPRQLCPAKGGRLASDELERPRLGRVALEEAGALEVCKVACTVEGEARPTASPISRTVGG